MFTQGVGRCSKAIAAAIGAAATAAGFALVDGTVTATEWGQVASSLVVAFLVTYAAPKNSNKDAGKGDGGDA